MILIALLTDVFIEMTTAKMLNVFHELICLLKPKEVVIIDIGCGVGYSLKTLKEDRFQLIGLDLSASEIIEAKKTRANLPIEFVVGDAQHLPFKEKSAEGIICSNLLEHVRLPLLVIKEIRRVLKPKSFSLIEIPNGYSLNEYTNILFGKMNWSVYEHKHRFTSKEIEFSLYTNDFYIVKKHSRGMIIAPIATLLFHIRKRLSSDPKKETQAFAKKLDQNLEHLRNSLFYLLIAKIDLILSKNFSSMSGFFCYLVRPRGNQ